MMFPRLVFRAPQTHWLMAELLLEAWRRYWLTRIMIAVQMPRLPLVLSMKSCSHHMVYRITENEGEFAGSADQL